MGINVLHASSLMLTIAAAAATAAVLRLKHHLEGTEI